MNDFLTALMLNPNLEKPWDEVDENTYTSLVYKTFNLHLKPEKR